MANFQTIIFQREDDIGIVTLNRPDKFNAVNQKMTEELISLVGGLNEDKKTRALIITGAGQAFCSGGDFSKEGG